MNKIHEILNSNTNIIEPSEVTKYKTDALEYLKTLELRLSKDEFLNIKHRIESYAVPTPRLLLIDHKKLKINGIYPKRLVVPMQNFNSRFSKLEYLSLKECFEHNRVSTDKNIIT